jgi:stress response protein SCP2
MGINLQKGQKISLAKEAPNLSKVIMGLGWDVRKKSSQKSGGFLGSLFGGGASQEEQFDLDAACLMLNSNDKLFDFVYFGNLTSKCGSVIHSGDNLTGEGDGDDEQIRVDLNRVPPDVKKLIFLVNIYKANDRKQDFGMVENAFVRMVNADNNQEIAKYNLSDNYPGKTTMYLAEVYRHNNEWKMGAIGEGTTDSSLSEIANKYK